MPAADQVVSVTAAFRPSIFWGHHQPLVDAEHIPLSRPIHCADREDHHRDQAPQHRPRANSLHTHPCGCGSVMESKTVRSGLIWSKLACTETITKDLCNRLEAARREGWPAVLMKRWKRLNAEEAETNHHNLVSPCKAWPSWTSRPQLLDFPNTASVISSSPVDSDEDDECEAVCWRAWLCMHRHLRRANTVHVLSILLNGKWTLSYVTSCYAVFCSASVFSLREEQRRWQRGFLKCLLWDCWGTWKYLNLKNQKRLHLKSAFSCSLLCTLLYIFHCCFPLMGLDQ